MVLSNKKLKAKLRAELTTSIVDAPSPIPSSNSLKLLLDSASHKPILSKRDKRRKLQPLQPLHKNEQTNTENPTEGSDKNKNKKRKRKVENQNDNYVDDVDNVVVSSDKSKKKKKVEKQNGDVEVANGVVSNEQSKKKKLKKKKVEENQNDDVDVANGVVSNEKSKKKKQKKKVENQNDDEVANEIVSNDAVTKQSKKKKVEKQNDDVANDVSSDAVTTKLSKKKRLLKKKKKREQKKKKKAKTAEENGKTQEGEMLKSTVPELTKTNTTTTTTTTTATSQETVEVPTKVYVGGIPYYSTEDDIRSYFEGCGTITEIDCMYFPETGKFRGIAFIGFKTEAAAKRALAFDGADMGGFFLKIQPYKADKAARPARYDPEIMEGYNRIYVGNLSWDMTEEELKKFFSNCNIASIQFGMDKETGEFRGYAHVDFSDSQSLKTALKLDQSVLFGRPVRISCAVPLKKKPGPSKKLGGGEKSGAGEKAGEKPSPPVPVDSKMKGRTCYECGKKGHSFSACPNKAAVTSTTI